MEWNNTGFSKITIRYDDTEVRKNDSHGAKLSGRAMGSHN